MILYTRCIQTSIVDNSFKISKSINDLGHLIMYICLSISMLPSLYQYIRPACTVGPRRYRAGKGPKHYPCTSGIPPVSHISLESPGPGGGLLGSQVNQHRCLGCQPSPISDGWYH